MFQETPWLSNFAGDVIFETGPLLSLTIDDSNPDAVASHYLFGPGTLTLTAHWSDQFGAPVEGRYIAPLLDLLIDITCEQELSARDCGDSFGGSHGYASASFGPGLFERSLASALGIARSGGAFSFLDLAIDGVTGGPPDALRLAGSAAGQLAIGIPVEAPEPSVVSLLLLSSVLGLRRRR